MWLLILVLALLLTALQLYSGNPRQRRLMFAMWAGCAVSLGLTIVGLVGAFGAISAADPTYRQERLANGISEAFQASWIGAITVALCALGSAWIRWKRPSADSQAT